MKHLGVLLISAVSVWDIDAMRPHIAQHSWVTLGYVSLFLIGHVTDYLDNRTIG
jgi:hypothetical protein